MSLLQHKTGTGRAKVYLRGKSFRPKIELFVVWVHKSASA